MWLLDKMLRKLIKKGELIVTNYDGKEYRYGAPDPNHGPVHARLTDRGAAWHIAKDPRVGAGEAYMDKRLVIEPPSDIRDLVLLIRYNAPFEKPGALKPKGPITRSLNYVTGKLDQINWKSRSRRNAEHTYNLTRRLYGSSWMPTGSTPAPIIATRRTAWNRRSSTRRRTSPPSCTSSRA